jgi:hypothetical protein
MALRERSIMTALARRVIAQLLILTLPLIVLVIIGMTFSDTDDREMFTLLLTLPFAAIFFAVLGRAVFETFQAVVTRAVTGALKTYWLVSVVVFLLWLGSILALLWR